MEIQSVHRAPFSHASQLTPPSMNTRLHPQDRQTKSCRRLTLSLAPLHVHNQVRYTAGAGPGNNRVQDVQKDRPTVRANESLHVNAFEGIAFGNLTFHVSRLTRNYLRMLADFFSILLAQV
jgi:hypothetical protein